MKYFLKDLLTDDVGKYSMMRFGHLICMIISVMLASASIFLAINNLEYSSFLSSSVAFAGIGTAGKAVQKTQE